MALSVHYIAFISASSGGEDVASELEKQRRAMEDDFGKQRAKFKEMFLQKEGAFCPRVPHLPTAT